MFTTFNMGIGMMLFTEQQHSEALVSSLKAAGEGAVVIGEVIADKGERVELL